MELFCAKRRLKANLELRQAVQVTQCGLLYPSAHTARPSYTSSFTLQAPAAVACFFGLQCHFSGAASTEDNLAPVYKN